MSDDIKKRLREVIGNKLDYTNTPNHLRLTAADRIEELEADLREMALNCLAADGQAVEAYQAQLVAEAKLASVIAAYRIEAMRREDYSHKAFDQHIAELKGDSDDHGND